MEETMDFKHLDSFVMISRVKSFSKAAEKLFLTQPTISNHINSLEKELNTILFNRSNKVISLTSSGDILLKHAIAILNERDQALFTLEQFKGEIIGTLDIASSTIPERYLLSSLMCEFSSSYPGVKYNLMRFDSKQVIDRILSGEVDFGIVGSRKEAPQLIYNELFHDEIILIAPNNEKYKNISTLSLDLLKDHRLIMRESGSGTRSTFEQHLKNVDMNIEQFNIVAYMENTETIKEVVKKGLGVSFVSKRAAETDLSNGQLKSIPIDNFAIHRNFYFVYHKKRILSPLSETFRDFILEKVKPARN